MKDLRVTRSTANKIKRKLAEPSQSQIVGSGTGDYAPKHIAWIRCNDVGTPADGETPAVDPTGIPTIYDPIADTWKDFDEVVLHAPNDEDLKVDQRYLCQCTGINDDKKKVYMPVAYDASIWGKITAVAGDGSYTLTEQKPDDDTAGTFSGSGGDLNANEVNGQKYVANGTIVRLWPHKDYFLFEHLQWIIFGALDSDLAQGSASSVTIDGNAIFVADGFLAPTTSIPSGSYVCAAWNGASYTVISAKCTDEGDD